MEFLSRFLVTLLLSILVAPASLALDIKGISLGATFDEVRARYGGDMFCRGSVSKRMTCRKKDGALDVEDRYSSRRMYIKGGDSYAGAPVNIVYEFSEGRLVSVTILGIRPSRYEEMISSLTEKFGKRSRAEKVDVVSGGGAILNGEDSLWIDGRHRLMIDKYSDTIDESFFLLIDEDFSKQMAEERDRRRKDDM